MILMIIQAQEEEVQVLVVTVQRLVHNVLAQVEQEERVHIQEELGAIMQQDVEGLPTREWPEHKLVVEVLEIILIPLLMGEVQEVQGKLY